MFGHGLSRPEEKIGEHDKQLLLLFSPLNLFQILVPHGLSPRFG